MAPKVAFFELSSCEGCQLQIVNNEATLLDFLSLVDVRVFREAMTEKYDDYDIAFIEGSVTRADEIERLKKVRAQAKVLVAFGSAQIDDGVRPFEDTERLRLRDLMGRTLASATEWPLTRRGMIAAEAATVQGGG